VAVLLAMLPNSQSWHFLGHWPHQALPMETKSGAPPAEHHAVLLLFLAGHHAVQRGYSGYLPDQAEHHGAWPATQHVVTRFSTNFAQQAVLPLSLSCLPFGLAGRTQIMTPPSSVPPWPKASACYARSAALALVKAAKVFRAGPAWTRCC